MAVTWKRIAFEDELHSESHNVASHSDTTATGTELDTLTDNSIADTLHRHSELVASDGSPDPAVSVDDDGIVDIPYQSGCSVRLSEDQVIPTTEWTKLLLATEDWDTQGEFADNKFTAKKAGKYIAILSVYLQQIPDGKTFAGAIKVNGNYFAYANLSQGAADNGGICISNILNLAVGNYVEGFIYQNSGGNLTAQALTFVNVLSIQKIA